MKTYSIGRDPGCDIVINDTTDVISRRHAILNISPSGKMTIVDQSTNGTYINGIKISSNAPVPVTRKDTISFAHVAKLDWGQVPSSNKVAKFVILGTLALVILGCGSYLVITKDTEGDAHRDEAKSQTYINNTISTNTTEVKCLAEGGEYSITFKCDDNSNVTATSNANWITSIAINNKEEKVVFNVIATESEESRSAKLTLTYGKDNSVDIDIIQAGKLIFALKSPADITLPSNAKKNNEILYTLKNPIEGANVKAEVSSENAEWITISKIEDDKILYSVTKNTSDKKREATLTITYGYKSHKVTIRQKAGKQTESTKEDKPKEETQEEESKNLNYIG